MKKLKYGILLAAVLGITLFIFGNSFLSYDLSHNTSNSVSEIILPDEYSHDESALTLIRKAAHLIEYAALGFFVMLLVTCIQKDFGKRLHAAASFYVLLAAVLDEHIQSFSDRTSSTGDILLDFLGALLGFSTVFVMQCAFRNLKKFMRKV